MGIFSIFNQEQEELKKAQTESLNNIQNQQQLEDQNTPGSQDNESPDTGPVDPIKEIPIDQNSIQSLSGETLAQQDSPFSFNDANTFVKSDPNTWSPEYTQMGFLEKAGRSIARGFMEQVVGGTGDLLMFASPIVGNDIIEGNMASRWLQEVGSEYGEPLENYVSKDFINQMENNAWSFKTFMMPEFWSNSVAEGIPMLVEMILLSKGGSIAARKIAQKGLSSLAKKQGIKVIEDVAGKAIRGAGKAIEKSGSGIAGKLIKETGELTKLGASASDFIGGGMTMNLLAGLQNAAELVNQYKDTGIYSEDELRQMAAATVTNNMKYLPIDMLSWGFTYGKESGIINKGVKKLISKSGTQVEKLFSKGQQLKQSALSFANSTNPLIKAPLKALKVAGYALPEGIEETFQETFEEWSKIKAKEKVTGESPKYDSYWDFYMSKENEQTKAVSLALGMLGGAGGSIMTAKNHINEQADLAYKLYDKSELLKNIISNSDPKMKEAQIQGIHEMLINNKYHGGIDNTEYIDSLLEKEIIDEAEHENLINKAVALDEAWTNFEKMEKQLNIKGKVAYTTSILNESQLNSNLNDINEDYLNQVELLKSTIKDPKILEKKLNELNAAFTEKQEILEDNIAYQQFYQQSILSEGKAIDVNKFRYFQDENGQEQLLTGLTQEKFDEFYSLTDDQILKEASINNKGFFKSLGKKFNDFKENIFSKNDNDEQPLQNENNDISQTDEVKSTEEKNNEEEESIKNENENENEFQVPEGYRKVEDGEVIKAGDYKTVFDQKNNITYTNAPKAEGKNDIKEKSDYTPIKDFFEDLKITKQTLTKNEENGKIVARKFLKELDQDGYVQFDNIIKKEIENQSSPEEIFSVLKKKGYDLNISDKEFADFIEQNKNSSSNEKEKSNGKVGKQSKSNLENSSVLSEAEQYFEKERIDFKRIDSQETMDAWVNHNLSYAKNGLEIMSQSMAINGRLKSLFPNSNIQSYPVKKLFNIIGPQTLGYAIANSVFIDENTWEQEDIYMHEMSHIYYAITKEEPFTKNIILEARKNKELVSELESNYPEFIYYRADKYIPQYKIKKGTVLRADMIPNVLDEEFENYFSKAPAEYQSEINEELFANFLQGPLSKTFNKYFLPKNEGSRKVESKKWWKEMKNSVPQNEANYIISKVSDNNDVQLSFESIVRNFTDKLNNNVVLLSGRESRHSKMIDQDIKRLLDIKEKLKIAQDNYNPKIQNPDIDTYQDFLEDIDPEGVFHDLRINQQVDEDVLNISYDKSYERMQSRSGEMLHAFFRKYKQEKRLFESKRSEEEQIRSIKDTIQFRDFASVIIRSAQEEENYLKWMDGVINPHESNILNKEFSKFLEDNYGNNKYVILRSMYSIYSNTDTYPVIIGVTDDNGYTSFDQSLSFPEGIQGQAIISRFDNLKESEKYKQSLFNIKNGTGIDQDYKLALELFSTSFVMNEFIANKNQILLNNSYTDLKTFFDYYLKGNNIIKNESLFREMIKNILVTSRMYSSDAIVYDPRNNYTSSKHLSNSLSKKYKKIRKYLESGMSKDDFLNALNNRTNINYTNHYLSWIYDQYKDKKSLPVLSLYVGDINDITGKKIPYKSTDAHTLYITDVLSFMTPNKAYITSMNTFGNSNRRIVTNMNRYMLDTPTIGKQHAEILKEVYNLYSTSAKNPVSFDKWKNQIQNEINNRIKHFNDNYDSYSKYNELKSLYQNGKLNADGKRILASHEFSTILNHYFIHELLTPSVPIENIIKRNKMNISPFMTISNSMRIENIFIEKEFTEIPVIDDFGNVLKDESGNIVYRNIESNDSGQFITDKTAKKLADGFKGVVDLNFGYKLVNYSIEKENPVFKNKAFALKGYTTIITEELANKFPKLKIIYDALNEREARFEKWAKEKNIEISEMYGDGGYDYIAIASPLSSVKGYMFSPEQERDLNKLASLDNISSPETNEKYHELMHKFHYDKNNDFIGFDGSNLGPQMRMDMIRYKAKVGVQLKSNVLAMANALGDLKESENILQEYNRAVRIEATKNLLKYIYENTDGVISGNVKNGEELAKFVFSKADKDKMNPIEKFLLSMDDTSIFNPRLTEVIKNQMRNLVIRYMNNFEGPGTIAQQKSELAGKIIDEETKESKKLNYYTQRKDGSYKSMEGILPGYMKNKLRARQYFNNSNQVKALLLSDNELMDEFSIDENNIDSFIEENTVTTKSGKIKYYLPGENVVVTRVPSSGPSFTGVMEVVDFDTTGASNIMIPSEFKEVIGSDDDGDQLFINTKDKSSSANGAYNNFLNKLMKKWLSRKMNPMLTTSLDSTEQIDNIISEIHNLLPKSNVELNDQQIEVYAPFSSRWAMRNHNNALGSSQTIGIAFNYHRLFNGISTYETELVTSIDFRKEKASITLVSPEGKVQSYNKFFDNPDLKKSESRIHKSNTITQIVLDSEKNNQAEALGLNKYTIGYAMILTNLGFDLKSVGLFLNQPIVKEYVSKVSTRGNLYLETETQNSVLRELALKTKGLRIWDDQKANYSVDLSKEKSFDKENQFRTLQLINYLNSLSSDIETINKVLKGHKSIDNDPSVLQNQYEEFNRLINNTKQNSSLKFSEGYKNNPEVDQYLKAIKTAEDVLSAMSIIHNKTSDSFYNALKKSIYHDHPTENQLYNITRQLQIYNDAKILGINNYSKKQLEDIIDIESPNGLYFEYEDYVDELLMSNTVFSEIDGTVIYSDFHRNKFLSNVAVIGIDDTGKLQIRTTEHGKDDTLTKEEIEDIQKDFAKLPQALQEKIIVADLILNEWKGKNSLQPFFDKAVVSQINKNANTLNTIQNNREANPKMIEKVKDIIINNEMNKNNPEFEILAINYSPGENILPIDDPRTIARFKSKLVNNKGGKTLELLLQKPIDKIKPVLYFKLQRYDSSGNVIDKETSKFDRLFLKVEGYSPTEKVFINEYKAREKMLNWLDKMNRINFIKPETKSSYNIDLIAIPDNNVKFDLQLNPTASKESQNFKKKRIGMSFKGDFHNFTSTDYLNRDQFLDSYQSKYPLTELQKGQLYNRYISDKEDANKIAGELSGGNVYKLQEVIHNMSDENLLKIYKDYGWKDAYAYSIIIVPTLLELNKRSLAEQTKLTGRAEGDSDISLLKAYFQANNIDSSHPATQSIIRQLEIEYKKFLDEKKKYVRKLNEVTDKLYNEKLGDKLFSSNYLNKVVRAAKVFFSNRNDLYEKLYGNIIDITESESETGKTIKLVRLKKQSELDSLLKSKKISKTEYDFAKVYREIVSDISQFSGKKDYATKGFIPAVAMTRMEAFSHRGLLGLLGSSNPAQSAIYDVKMKFKGQQRSFKEIHDYFKYTAKNNYNNVRDYLSYKNKAEKLLKENKNEDGSRIEVSNIANISFLGDGMIERFSNDEYQYADDFVSMDLNKALYDYIHNTLFVTGNDQFSGFLKLQSLVDGLLIHNQQKGFLNQNKFVKGVVKNGVLSNKRDSERKTHDKVIDAMVYGNLMYVLGYKALVLQHGAYAIGNMVIGKYHNIKNAGGKTWVKGEDRFWGISNGKLGTKKSSGVLDSLNFSDYNVYDEIDMDNKAGIGKIFTDIALSPMIATEHWVQGVHFLGLLTNEEWNKFDDNGNYLPNVEKISPARVTEIENIVKNSHGKGYTVTDQRLIQKHSWGRMIMQFGRFIPTMWYDRFAKEDIDIYGRYHVGSLRKVGEVISKMMSGEISTKEFVRYRAQLPKEQREILDAGLRGMAITTVAMLLGSIFNINTLNEMTGDANYLFNQDKMERKIMPSTVRTTMNLLF